VLALLRGVHAAVSRFLVYRSGDFAA